jgi:P-type conjugative transfer ATPase TrbB
LSTANHFSFSSPGAERLKQRWCEDIPPCVLASLADDKIIEIMINPDGKILVDDLSSGIRSVGIIEPDKAEAFANLIASLMGTSITAENPVCEGELPFDGSRVALLIPPVVAVPTISIRRKAVQLFSLEDYVQVGSLGAAQCDVIRDWILARKNILVAGGTASGKTTLINAIIAEIARLTPEHRLIVLEDTIELQCQASNVVQMRSSEQVSLQALVKTTLRHRPDRIIVGEVRGKEAFDLLTAWSTGHPGGVASLHANSAHGAFLRLEQLLEMATQSPMRSLIGEAVDAIIYIEKTGQGRQIQQLLEVKGFDQGRYLTHSH